MKILNHKNLDYLNTALNVSGLKAKHISGENWITLINLKKKLKNEVDDVAIKESAAADEAGYSLLNGQLIPKDGEQQNNALFSKRLIEIHNTINLEIESNFIPEKEFREYVKEIDTSTIATLFEFLMEEKA